MCLAIGSRKTATHADVAGERCGARFFCAGIEDAVTRGAKQQQVSYEGVPGGVLRRPSRFIRLACVMLVVGVSGCSVLRKKEERSEDQVALQLSQKPMSPEKAQGVLSEMGENWLYGPGLGQTALNVGAMVVFPPYAIYVLGNSVLSMSGYEPLYVTDLLPDEERSEVNEMYDEVTTAPGRVSASLAGKEFRTKDVAAARLRAVAAEGATPAKGRGKKASSGG